MRLSMMRRARQNLFIMARCFLSATKEGQAAGEVEADFERVWSFRQRPFEEGDCSFMFTQMGIEAAYRIQRPAIRGPGSIYCAGDDFTHFGGLS